TPSAPRTATGTPRRSAAASGPSGARGRGAAGPSVRAGPDAARRADDPRAATVAPPRSGSAQQAIHPAVAEALAAGLARRAVRDLVALVGDVPEVVAAARARLARVVVHDEVVADLRGQAVPPAALGLERVVEDRADRRAQAFALLGVELAELRR